MSNILIIILSTFFCTTLCIAQTDLEYFFKFSVDAKIGDGILTIVKSEDHLSTTVPTKKQLIELISVNPSIAAAFRKHFGDNADFLDAVDSNAKITFSDLSLYKILKNFNNDMKFSDLNRSPECNNAHLRRRLKITSWSEPPVEDLKVPAGEIYPIFAGSILHFKSVTIEPGAAVVINEGRQKITYIKSDGDCNINGKFISRRFKSGSSTFKETSPDGETLTVNLDETNKGGGGGRGGSGSYRFCIASPPIPGGQGAFGTAEYGGGGGGGSRMYYAGKCLPMQGLDASGKQGGKSSASHGTGGDGAGRTPKRNGGYLYLKCLGKISLKGGLDFRGEPGVKGDDGEAEGAGGGGGGPGGQGGVLFINKPPVDYNPKNYDFSGAIGGIGGQGGRNQPGDRAPQGTDGEDGKGGESGFSGDMELVLP